MLDVISFAIKILELAAAGPATGSAYSRYYLLETAQVTWKQLATEMAPILYQKGLFSSPEPRSVSFEGARSSEVKHLVGANLLIKGDRAVNAGFKAAHEHMLRQMHQDLEEAVL